MSEIGDDYRERLANWVVEEQKRTGLTDRDFADRLGLSHASPYYWRAKKLKKPLADESINAIARYRGESPNQIRDWLEGRSPDSQLGLADEVEALKQRLAVVEQLLSEALKNMSPPKSIPELVKRWQLREGLSQLQLELQVTTIGLISAERFREVVAGLSPEQITDDDLAVVGALVMKGDGSQYNLLELRAIRDQSPSSILDSLSKDCDCEDSSEANHHLK